MLRNLWSRTSNLEIEIAARLSSNIHQTESARDNDFECFDGIELFESLIISHLVSATISGKAAHRVGGLKRRIDQLAKLLASSSNSNDTQIS